MKNFLASLSLGRTPDARLNLSVAIGSTILRQIVASGLYFIAIWITTRQLGPQQNGVLATALLLPQTLYAFLNLGIGPSHVYHLSNGSGNHLRMRNTNWVVASALWLAVVLVLAVSSDAHIARYLPGVQKNAALFASLLFPMMLLAAWSSSLIQGNRDYQAYNKTLLIQPLVFCSGIVLLRMLDAITVVAVLSCYIVSQMSLWLLSEAKISRFGAPAAKASHTFVDAIKFGLRAHVSNVITFMNYRLALYLVSYLLGATATGKYALSIQLAEVLWLISSAASMIVFPESAAHNRAPAELQKMIRKVAGSVFQVTCAGALVAAALSPVAIPLIFGKAYEGSVVPFLILLPGIVVWSYMSVLSNSLAGMGYQKINIHSALLCLLINIVGDVMAIPRFGANGAALASTLAFSMTALYTAVVYNKIMAERLKAV
ncbi:MAG: oligosaccharide flippase family protein [Pseudomonadota bacterium]|nr:oligosaccharide flippase family protein [Pseudomonadota bacterium]